MACMHMSMYGMILVVAQWHWQSVRCTYSNTMMRVMFKMNVPYNIAVNNELHCTIARTCLTIDYMYVYILDIH